METRLGFSTGALYKFCTVKESLKILKNLGISTVELGFIRLSRIKQGQLDEITKEDLEGFNYVSFHAPKYSYGINEGTKFIFSEIEKINKIRHLDAVIFHPDCIEDISAFHHAPFQVLFENMDNRKSLFQTPENIKRIVDENDNFKVVLDVNHIYTNDPTMKLASRFYEELGNKIVQIHLSGYKEFHDPLYMTKQTGIIAAIKDLTVPLIIESVISPDEIEKERNYILEAIQKT
jgi:endonuclease IV